MNLPRLLKLIDFKDNKLFSLQVKGIFLQQRNNLLSKLAIFNVMHGVKFLCRSDCCIFKELSNNGIFPCVSSKDN